MNAAVPTTLLLENTFTFASPWMALASLLIALPILIHLLNRARHRVEPWGAMMFLDAAVRSRKQRMKLERQSLLVMRCAVFILLAAILVQPIRTGPVAAQAGGAAAHVLVIDRSLSTADVTSGRSTLQRIQQSARRILAAIGPRDDVALVTTGHAIDQPDLDPPRGLIEVQRAIDGLTAADGAADFPAALEAAEWLVTQSDAPTRRVYLLTDDQARNWSQTDRRRLEQIAQRWQRQQPPPTLVALIHPMPRPTRNLAVAAVEPRSGVTTARDAALLVHLVNHHDQPLSGVLEMSINGQRRLERRIEAPPGLSTTVFDYRFREPGPHALRVQLTGDDFQADNQLHHVVFVHDRLDVLLIDGRAEGDRSARWLALALDTAEGPDAPSPVQLDRVGPFEVSEVDLAMLEPYQAVILADAVAAPHQLQYALARFVEAGGGLLIVLGNDADPEAINRMMNRWPALAAATLASASPLTPRTDARVRLTADAGVRVLPETAGRTGRALPTVRVNRLWSLRPADGASILARVGDAPWLVHQPRGRGRVAIWAGPLDQRTTNLAASAAFLPWVHELLADLGSTIEPPLNVPLGQPIEIRLDRWTEDGTAPDAVQWRPPGGPPQTVTLDKAPGRRNLRLPAATRTGVHRITRDDRTLVPFAVQRPAGESNPEPLTTLHRNATEAIDLWIDVRDPRAADLAVAGRGAIDLWPPIVLVLLGWLLIELYAAWRFSE